MTRGAVAIVAAWTLVWSGVPASALAQVADSPHSEEVAALEEKRPDDSGPASSIAGEAPASEPASEVEAPDEPSAKPDETQPQDDGNAKEAASADVAEDDGLAVSTQASGENIASGTWGTCPWEIDSEGTLRVHAGEGADLSWRGAPWYSNRAIIKSAVFDGDVELPSSCSHMFKDCSSLASVDVSGWDMSSVTDISSMFSGCLRLTSLDLSGWDVSGVTDASAMFYDCASLTSLRVSGWDVSSLADMGSMFEKCPKLTSLDISGWAVSGVTDMSSLFLHA